MEYRAPWVTTCVAQQASVLFYRTIAAGIYHSLALCDDGTIWGWGDNDHGSVGDGTATDAAVPTQENSKTTDWRAVSAGGAHSLALRADGTLWGWGRNEFGELGDNTTTDRHVPTQEVSGSTDWAAISSGMSFSLGLKNDGTLWTWGLNDKGQLGDGTIVDKHEPTRGK